jgi:hypothetical protein
MKLRLLTTALVAMAGAFATQSANAQYTAAAGGEDMILSFYDTASSTDNIVQVDLGQVSLFTGATPTGISINLNTDLTNQFGSGWFSNSSLEWSVDGTNNSAGTENFLQDSIYISTPSSTAVGTKSFNQLGSIVTAISNLYNPNGTAGANSPGVAANTDILAPSNAENFNSVSSGGTFSTGDTIVNFFNGSTSTMDLDVLQPKSPVQTSTKASQGTVTVEPGLFTINSAGVVSFGTAVPEPSTYALMLVGALLLAFQINRRKSSASRL